MAHIYGNEYIFTLEHPQHVWSFNKKANKPITCRRKQGKMNFPQRLFMFNRYAVRCFCAYNVCFFIHTLRNSFYAHGLSLPQKDLTKIMRRNTLHGYTKSVALSMLRFTMISAYILGVSRFSRLHNLYMSAFTLVIHNLMNSRR